MNRFSMTDATTPNPDIYLGIMTGTSLDAIDVAACRFTGKHRSRGVQLLGFHSTPWPTHMCEILMDLATSSMVSMDVLTRSHFLLAKYYADAVQETLAATGLGPKDIRAIGLHGQTVRHLPGLHLMEELPPVRATLQLGSGSALAAISGVDVVSDFRSADVALGGQGAPLVPMFDYEFLTSETVDRMVVNIGGIANVTWLPHNAKPENVVAFDCGPGNMLLDAVTRKYFGEAFDRDGDRARQGSVDNMLLAKLLSHPYFQKQPPKSTGRELFGASFLTSIHKSIEDGVLSPSDALSTLTEFTARSIVGSIDLVNAHSNNIEIILSGGGAYNSYLHERIKRNAFSANVLCSDILGIPASAKEAIAFAFFAKAFLEEIPIHLPHTTGAIRSAKLGSLSRGSQQ